MDGYIALTLFGSFFILVFLGVPISFSTVSSMLLMFSWDIAVITVSQRLANGLDNFALLAIPFIFAGTLMNRGGIALRLINLAQVMVGRVPGSLGR
jgi:TRAP-type mannitol/chloroaromatic compound transport system permease large subunit